MTKQEWPKWLGQEPTLFDANDSKVLINGKPYQSSFRMVHETTFQYLMEDYWAAQATLSELYNKINRLDEYFYDD